MIKKKERGENMRREGKGEEINGQEAAESGTAPVVGKGHDKTATTPAPYGDHYRYEGANQSSLPSL